MRCESRAAFHSSVGKNWSSSSVWTTVKLENATCYSLHIKYTLLIILLLLFITQNWFSGLFCIWSFQKSDKSLSSFRKWDQVNPLNNFFFFFYISFWNRNLCHFPLLKIHYLLVFSSSHLWTMHCLLLMIQI